VILLVVSLDGGVFMAKKPSLHNLRLNKRAEESRVRDYLNNQRVRQLSALRIYHQKNIDKIDQELGALLKDDVDNIDY
jgi:hypothetical protein